MTRALRYVLAATTAALFATGMCLLLHETRQQRARYDCKEIDVIFEDSLRFVSEAEIRAYISEEYGTAVGERLDSVGLSRIEEILVSKSAIMDAQAWTTDDGTLHVGVTQRAPALRFENNGKGFYVDDRGFIFPLHESYTAPVRAISGNIPVRVEEGFKGEAPQEADRNWIAGMLNLDSFISGSRVWRDSVDEITVLDGGDISFRTSRGEEEIILGTFHALADKFSALEKYYGVIAPQKGDEHYSKVILKYKKQIICRKDM